MLDINIKVTKELFILITQNEKNHWLQQMGKTIATMETCKRNNFF